LRFEFERHLYSGSQSFSQLKDTKNKPDSVESFSNERGKKRIRVVGNSSDDDDDDDDDDDELPLSDNELMLERSGRRKRTNKILDDMILDDDDDNGSLTDESLTDSNRSLTEDDNEASEASETFANNDRGLSEDEIPIEQFTASDFDDLNYESDHGYIDTNIDFNNLWILLWIFKCQTRFIFRMLQSIRLLNFLR
jgi:hypothetical protein